MNFSLFAVLYIAGMMFYDFTAQSVPVNMCVNFCCSDRFVAQHTLYGAQVGSSFKQVGGKGMAEGVRTDVFGDAGLLRQFHADVSGTMDAITATGKLTPEQTDTILNAWKAYEGGESHGVQ